MRNEEYSRKILPFLKQDYFVSKSDKFLFTKINEFVTKYNTLPTVETIQITIENSSDQMIVDEARKTVQEFNNVEDSNIEWLVDQTEEFCKSKALYLAMTDSLAIMNDSTGKRELGSIPSLLSDALAVSFDTHIGHDYIGNYLERFDFYHKREEKIPFDLDKFNDITKGGVSLKTLNIILAGTGVGKTAFMCHLAASYLMQGKNVLYITLEMAEERIAERIDANLLNVDIGEIENLPRDMFETRFTKMAGKTNGRLIIKEYPTSSASVANFNALVNELFLKKNFRPDVVFIDYINICISSRFRLSGNVGMYSYIKAIAEEFRGFAVENRFVVWSATQTNRSGFANSDPDLTDTAESFGLPATADFMFSLYSDEELEKLAQVMVKQLKNRYNDIVTNKRFGIGVDMRRMKFYNLDESAQKGLTDSGQESLYTERKQPKDKLKELLV